MRRDDPEGRIPSKVVRGILGPTLVGLETCGWKMFTIVHSFRALQYSEPRAPQHKIVKYGLAAKLIA